MKLMVLSGPKVLPHPALCQKRCASCFCFPRKKTFFYEKIFFCILHYSTALPESSSIMKITNFMKSHDFETLRLLCWLSLENKISSNSSGTLLGQSRAFSKTLRSKSSPTELFISRRNIGPIIVFSFPVNNTFIIFWNQNSKCRDLTQWFARRLSTFMINAVFSRKNI